MKTNDPKKKVDLKPTSAQAVMFSRGRITIPKIVRDEAGLKGGDEVEFYQRDDGVVVMRKVTAAGPTDDQ